MSFAKRIAHLKAEGAYAVLARAQELEAQGREIIHLETGQPDFDTYPHITLAGIRAMTTGQTRYNPPPAFLPCVRPWPRTPESGGACALRRSKSSLRRGLNRSFSSLCWLSLRRATR